ncbi:MAG: sortase [Candidatus Levyibacteriota bacterium]
MPTSRNKTAKKRSKRKVIRKRPVKRKSFSLQKSLQKFSKRIRKFFYKKERVIGTAFIVVGICAVLFPSGYTFIASHNFFLPQTKLQVQKTKTTKETKTNPNGPIIIDKRLLSNKENVQDPQRIVIPTLKIDLPIVEAPIVNGYWETSDTTASHGVGSASPGQNGNIVVFAHAREGLFLPLKDITNDETVYILTKDHWKAYRVTNIQFVTPDQTQVIAPTDTETLTLYTCSGFFDEKRIVVTAKPY